MRKLLLWIIVAVVPVLASCGDDPTGPDSNPAGTYQLATLNARPVPTEFVGTEILSGSLVLNRDGTFQSSTTSRVEDFETGTKVTETETETGTYAHSGNIIRFTTDRETIEGNYDGNSITINVAIIVLVYRR